MAAKKAKLDITINHCRKLPVVEDKSVTYFVKVEFADSLLGESPRVEVKGGGNEAVFNLTAALDANGSGEKDLNDVINNPLLVSVLELLPKDKKSKEEKFNMIGQAAIDLVPVVFSSMDIQYTLSLISPTHREGGGPEVDIGLRVDTPFVPRNEATECNLLSVKMDSLYSVPAPWLPVGSGNFKFDMAVTLPMESSSGNPVYMANGVLHNGPSKDPEATSAYWKWSQLASTNSRLALMPALPVQPCALEDEDGELKDKDSHNFRFKAQKDMPRVTWISERRAWMNAASCKGLIERLSECGSVPLEVLRLIVPVPTGKSKGKEEETIPSHHGVAYVDLSALLYPGVSRIRGAYQLHPFEEGEFAAKGGGVPSYFASVVAKAQSLLLSVPAKGKATAKRSGSTAKISGSDSQDTDTNLDTSDSKETAVDGLEYREAKSYVILDISLSRPLVPRRPLNVLAERVSEYITPRPAVPRRLGGSEKALSDYHSHVAQMVNSLLAEYREMFGATLSSEQTRHDSEERKRKFLFYLNSSGKYYGLKENLKRTIVKVVRETFPDKSSSSSNQEELNLFIGELYTYLLDQMQQGIAQVLSLENPPPKPPSFSTSELLRLAAYEAEVYCDYGLADQYHRQRLVEEDHMASHWYDYGVHSLHCKNYEKAEQCFKQSLSLNSAHVPSLLAFSMCCALDERFEEGETFLEMATQSDPTSAIVWTVAGLFYELCGKPVNKERSLREAFMCGGYPGKKTVISVPNTLSSESHSQSIRQQWRNASTLGQSQVLSSKTAVEIQSQVSEVHSIVKPEAVVSTVLEQENTSQDVISIKSGAPLEQGLSVDSCQTKKSLADSSRVESMRSDDIHLTREGLAKDQDQGPGCSIFLATSEFLLDIGLLKFAEMSLSQELGSSDDSPCPAYHIARAKYFIQQGDYQEAETSVRAAITVDVQNPNAWATLGHLLYLSHRLPDAQTAYVRALGLVASCSEVHSVHLRLGDIYLKSDQFKQAKDIFLLACCDSPSAVTWRGVGIACYRLNELENAFDALCEANILNNHDPTVWAYLTLVCSKTCRLSEAEQAYKFTLKADLKDSVLLQELRSQVAL